MRDFDLYQFILCLIVFLLLTIIFTVGVSYLLKLNFKIIRAGLNDEKIKTEYLKNKGKDKSTFSKVFDKLVLAICCVTLFCAFGMALSVSESCNGEKVTGGIPSLNVVKSSSMAYRSKNNKYLEEGEVSNHLQKFDVIVVGELPKEEDLKVNDIVVYEIDGYFLVHRIVAIEESNVKHPNERHFLLHGDANDGPDRFPVLYDQIKGI